MAQAPQGFTYQGVATDNNGFELQNQTISIQASILSSSATGTTVWQETHTTTTDTFGLFNVTIGEGISTNSGSSATFQEIDWGAASHFMKVEIDVNGGSNYVHVGTSQMMSVPYALYAENVHNLNMDSILGAVYDSINTSFSSGAMSVSTFGDTLTLNGQSIIVPGVSFSNIVPVFGSVTDIEGNTYGTVSYGGVELMTENLRVATLNNGTPIPQVCNDCQFSNGYVCAGGWCYYNQQQFTENQCGKLYNGYLLQSLSSSGNNICPSGWHISTSNEWDLITGLFVLQGGSGTNGMSSQSGNIESLLASGSNESYLSLELCGGNDWNGDGGGLNIFGKYYMQGIVSGGVPFIKFDDPNGNYIASQSNFTSLYYSYCIRCVKD